MTKKRCVIWNNIQYESLTEAASALNISIPTLHERIENGYTCDDDLRLNQRTRRGKEVRWNGIVYPSVQDAAKACGISSASMSARLKKGYTNDNDLQRKKK